MKTLEWHRARMQHAQVDLAYARTTGIGIRAAEEWFCCLLDQLWQAQAYRSMGAPDV
jgi:hypothetical protein